MDKSFMESDAKTATEAGGDIVVFSILKPSACSECGAELWKGSLLKMEKQKPLCLECADLDHLVFLPRGDVALTRRSRSYSTLSAVVVRFSRARGRYERQGLLVESAALERAQEECLNDEGQRRIAREKASLARERADEKYSGRVGRSSAAKLFDATAIDLAVKAHVRHMHTEYDRLLSRGWERTEARSVVQGGVTEIMDR